MEQAYEMAVDALGLAITSKEEGQEIPILSEPYQITIDSDSFCAVIEFDLLAYKKRTNSRAVKKTLKQSNRKHRNSAVFLSSERGT